MNFPDAVRRVLTNYATFAGRARRSEFWFFYLFLLLAQIGASILDGAIFGWAASGPIGLLVSLGLLLPMIAVAARRLHDGGRSGWWMLLQKQECPDLFILALHRWRWVTPHLS